MSKTFEDVWDEVELSLQDAKGIAWDTCHKIYILLDDAQMELMKGYEYDPLIYANTTTPAEMLETIKSWFHQSCGLRFVDEVATNEENPNLGFNAIIPQGYEAEFCITCGEYGADYDQLCPDCREDWDFEEDEEE